MQPATQTIDVQSEATSELAFIPLEKLQIHPDNVRKTPLSDQEQDELTSSISHQGIIEPLVFMPDAEVTDGFLVVAGGRRLTSLHILATTSSGGMPSMVIGSWTWGGMSERAFIDRASRNSQDALQRTPAEEDQESAEENGLKVVHLQPLGNRVPNSDNTASHHKNTSTNEQETVGNPVQGLRRLSCPVVTLSDCLGYHH